jgi:hypothetical protein
VVVLLPILVQECGVVVSEVLSSTSYAHLDEWTVVLRDECLDLFLHQLDCF